MLSSLVPNVRTKCRFLASSVTSNSIPPPVSLGAPSILAQRRCLMSTQRPKKPLCNFILFCQERRPEIVDKCPELSFVQVSAQLGDEWKNLPNDRKQMFSAQFRELREKFECQKEEFYEVKKEIQQRRKARARQKRKEEWEQFKKPKKPATSFAFFLSEHFVKGEKPTTAQFVNISELWKNTSEEQKLPYVERASELREKYQMDLEEWKHRMVAEGREDLVTWRKTSTDKKERRTIKGEDNSALDALEKES